MDKLIENARHIIDVTIDSVHPNSLLLNRLKIDDNGSLTLESQYGVLAKKNENIIVVSFGKAALNMTSSLLSVIGQNWSVRGVVIAPISKSINSNPFLMYPEIELYQGGENNLPDEMAAFATSNIINMLYKAGPKDAVIVLISGGGSALLCSPLDRINIKRNITKMLFARGASISEVNAVRGGLSTIKHGGLANIAIQSRVSRINSLIISDVLGDAVSVIAGGPTCTTLADYSDQPHPYEVINKYNIVNEIPIWVKQLLQKPILPIESFQIPVNNYVIGSNNRAVEAACKKATDLNYKVYLGKHVNESVEVVASNYITQTLQIVKSLKNCPSLLQVCFVAGGEPTTIVRGPGLGGRSMELTLRFSDLLHLHKEEIKDFDVLLCAFGTDGQDGPTSAAGAMGCIELVEILTKKKLSIKDSLQISNSYGILQAGAPDYLIITGLTGTNVMDIHIILVHRKSL